MNTSQIKTFAQKGRNILLEGVASQLKYWGFSSKGEVIEEPVFVQGGAIHRGQSINDP